jgi:formate-dependent nitrite reductase cytochrome c552 subunit
VRKAEFWLTRLVDKYEEAKNLGVDESVLVVARDKHYDAHVHWEFWTASNGSYFHNPNAATDSLNKGMAISQDGIKLLDDAMAKKRGEAKTAALAPAPAAAPAAVPAAK